MDARITKHRLGNLLSYDWLKILAAIAAAVLVLCVFFTTVRTRPRDGQVFYVYAYKDLSSGTDGIYLGDRILSQHVFSYEILSTSVESFQGNSYGDAALTARRAAGEGTVMFVSDNDEYNEDGTIKTLSAFKNFAKSESDVFLDIEKYLADCEAYLMRFYGAEWRTGELNKDEADACFLARNKNDKRYLTEKKLHAGLGDEYARFAKLREDYLELLALLENGTFSLSYSEDEGGKEVAYGIGLGNLSGLSDLYYYTVKRGDETVRTAETVNLMLFDNHNHGADLKFETVSFLCYLAERYAK